MTQEALTNQQYINCLCFVLAFHATLGHVLVYGLDWPRAWVDFRHGLSLDGWPVWPDSSAEPIWMQACSTSYLPGSVWDDASMGHIALSGDPASCSSPGTIFNKGHRELYQNLYILILRNKAAHRVTTCDAVWPYPAHPSSCPSSGNIPTKYTPGPRSLSSWHTCVSDPSIQNIWYSCSSSKKVILYI